MYRDYSNVNNAVKKNYKMARENQTVEYVKYMREKYGKFDKKLNIEEDIKLLKSFVDLSDPDIDLPNDEHLYQSANAALEAGEPNWMIITCLIHDLGKIIYLRGCDEDGTSMGVQYGIVGDTFIVGCKIPDEIIFPEFNDLNPDMRDERYNTKYGIYKKKCGLENCLVSYGHDEYLYELLKYSDVKLPEEALYIIRFHSLYLHHKENAYEHLLDDKDVRMLPLLKRFNKYDLYSKNMNPIKDDVKNRIFLLVN
jgi:inositol oxygenase